MFRLSKTPETIKYTVDSRIRICCAAKSIQLVDVPKKSFSGAMKPAMSGGSRKGPICFIGQNVDIDRLTPSPNAQNYRELMTQARTTLQIKTHLEAELTCGPFAAGIHATSFCLILFHGQVPLASLHSCAVSYEATQVKIISIWSFKSCKKHSSNQANNL